jgi:hypothetical protein
MDCRGKREAIQRHLQRHDVLLDEDIVGFYQD